jgi:acyl-CoA dehydrogenase
MKEETRMIIETTNRILRDHCTPEVVDAAESGQFAVELWRILEENGLILAGLPEHLGGAAGDLGDSLTVIRCAARFAAPIPIAEAFIAASLANLVGASSIPAGVATVATGDFELSDDCVLTGHARSVAFARWADRIYLPARYQGGLVLCIVDRNVVDITEQKNIAGEPRDTIKVDIKLEATEIHKAPDDIYEHIERLGAMTRAVMMSGALESTLELAVDYSLTRQQFGRSISKFQAIQHQLAMMAGDVAASIRSADSLVKLSEPVELEIAFAKSRIGQACGPCTEVAHQVMGAIGYTLEHHLNHRTRRLWSWREEYGSERRWQVLIGRQMCETGAEQLWPRITSL